MKIEKKVIKPKNKHQIASEKRLKKIILAAQTLFLERGFAGTSMGAISKVAQTNQSLIYHYFESKEALWVAVKEHILSQADDASHFDPHECVSAKSFIKQILEHRFELFREYPELARLMLWQRLEVNAKPLVSPVKISSVHWGGIIKGFQERGEIKKEINPDLLVSLMVSGFFAIVTEKALMNEGDRQVKSLEFLIQSLVNYACV